MAEDMNKPEGRAGHVSATLRVLRSISKHPYVNLTIGLGMLVTGIDELLERLFPDYETTLGLHHVVILLGFVYILHGFVELMERLEAARLFDEA